MSSDEVRVDVKLFNLAGALTSETQRDDLEPTFDVNVKLEEIERGVGEAAFKFAIAMETKPSIVRFDVNGVAKVYGKSEDIDRLLEVDPETKVPYLLKRIYQRIFVSIFLLSGVMNAPHPPPDLLFLSIKKAGEEMKPAEADGKV